MKVDDITNYLPKYLSTESQKELFDDIRKFIEGNNLSKIFTRILENENIIYQGDGLKGFKFYSFEKNELKVGPGLVLSNTCDLSLDNKRYMPTQILYAPIIAVSRYINILTENGISQEQINSHLKSIREQEITSIFYIPPVEGRIDESMVFLDRISNMRNSLATTKELLSERIFTLSNFGFYLFLLKLSIHFTRIREGVDRRTTSL